MRYVDDCEKDSSNIGIDMSSMNVNCTWNWVLLASNVRHAFATGFTSCPLVTYL